MQKKGVEEKWDERDMRHTEARSKMADYVNNYIKCEWIKHSIQDREIVRVEKEH